MKRYIIIAGETSGDTYGAELMKKIRAQHSQPVSFWGIGGNKMASNGLCEINDMHSISVVGFTEIVKKIPSILKLLNKISDFAKEIKPTGIILIDFPGFNLRLAKKINRSIPIMYFISPQLWAWNKKRISLVKKYVDHMLVIFPFEENFYKEHGVKVSYLGHPFLDSWKPSKKSILKKQLGLSISKKIIGIFPGSRKEELKRHLPIYLDAVEKLRSINSDFEFCLGLAPGFDANELKKTYNLDQIAIIDKKPLDLLECSDVAIVTSGTISLQASFMGTPCIVSYRLSFLSWIISRFLIKVKYISMTNIVLNKMLIPELIQHDVTSNNISKEVQKILKDKNIKSNLNNVKNVFMSKTDCIKNASKIIKNACDKNY